MMLQGFQKLSTLLSYFSDREIQCTIAQIMVLHFI